MMSPDIPQQHSLGKPFDADVLGGAVPRRSQQPWHKQAKIDSFNHYRLPLIAQVQ